MQSPSAVCDNVHLFRCRTIYVKYICKSSFQSAERHWGGGREEWLGNWIFCTISLEVRGETREKLRQENVSNITAK